MQFLHEDARSPVRWATPPHANIDSVIDVRGIYQQYHRDLRVDDLPPMLLPVR